MNWEKFYKCSNLKSTQDLTQKLMTNLNDKVFAEFFYMIVSAISVGLCMRLF